MDASIKESVKASDKEAQYDEKAKKLLGHKIILAYILVNTVEEFQNESRRCGKIYRRRTVYQYSST